MILYINNHHPKKRISRPYLEKKVRSLITGFFAFKKKSVPQNLSMGITFVNDAAIKKLNNKFRKKNKATDVLSFDGDKKSAFLGDLVISLDTTGRQALEHKKTLRDEIVFLIIHGFLHLNGYDHEKNKDWKIMEALQQKMWHILYPK